MSSRATLEAQIEAQIPLTLERTELSGLGPVERGKVRDIYRQDDRLILVATDRLSAFDRVLTTVPFKGELLTRIAVQWFRHTEDIIQNHLIDVPDPSVMVVRRCEPIPVEIIVRGYLTGSLWRDYEGGEAGAYGLPLPTAMRRDQAFPEPILTPTTKAARGEHDLPISREAILSRGLVDESTYARAEAAALALYARGVERSAKQGLILVDTKYEFGTIDGELVLMDEVHTPDSSRYWVAQGYADRFARGEAQQMLDKENIRQWLITTHSYQGHGDPPKIPAKVRVELALKYIRAYELLGDETFEAQGGSVQARIEKNLGAAGLGV